MFTSRRPNTPSAIAAARLATGLLAGLILAAGLPRVAAADSWDAAARALPVEIRLLPECRKADGLVLLGDVARVTAPDDFARDNWAKLELVPAPTRERALTLGEIRELLELQAAPVGACRFTGASVVLIRPLRASPLAGPTLAGATIRGSARAWAEDASPRDDAVRQVAYVAPARAPFAVRNAGGASEPARLPPVAAQPIMAQAIAAQPIAQPTATPIARPMARPEPRPQPAAATQATPPAREEPVVVARRALRRGEIVTPADVQWGPPPARTRPGAAAARMEDVLGFELQRDVLAGQTLDTSALQPPLLVKRGDTVAVTALAAGVQVRATGVAQESGAAGALIAVQSPDKRERYMARVVGRQQVQVGAAAPRVASPESSLASPFNASGPTLAVPPRPAFTEEASALRQANLPWRGGLRK